MTTSASSLKRKANSTFVPDSMLSYLVGSLKTNFDHLKSHINKDCAFAAAKSDSTIFMKHLLEELFRYLYLLADDSADGVVRSSPSYFVDQAFHCLLLDPVLYFRVCDEILTLQGQDNVKVRVLPHDALGGQGEDEDPRKVRYMQTLARYKMTFDQEPPLTLWTDYSTNATAVQAELQAQQAEAASARSPHGPSSRLQQALVSPAPVAASISSPLPTSSSGVARPPSTSTHVKLRIKDRHGNHLDLNVNRRSKFAAMFDEICSRTKATHNQIQLSHNDMVLRGYMTPYNLNMVDGDEITCSCAVGPAAIQVTIRWADDSFPAVVIPASGTTPLATVLATFATEKNFALSDCEFNYNGQVCRDWQSTLTALRYDGTRCIYGRKIALDETHITIKVRDLSGEEMFFKLKRSTTMQKVMQAFADRKGVNAEELRFFVEGTRLLPEDSPHKLDLEDGDQIDAIIVLRGC